MVISQTTGKNDKIQHHNENSQKTISTGKLSPPKEGHLSKIHNNYQI